MDSAPELDVRKLFVRLQTRRPDGLVAFEFAIGEPELFVELLLPAAAYEEFCARPGITHLSPRPEHASTDPFEHRFSDVHFAASAPPDAVAHPRLKTE